MKFSKLIKSILLIIPLILITSCSKNSAMKPEDFKNKEPRLIIENYLSGNVKAWGVLQNRSGKVTRQFSADLDGKWDGKKLILDEKFNWDDGEIQTRQWQITKIDETFKRMWEFYLSYCEAGFKSKNIDLIQFSLQNK